MTVDELVEQWREQLGLLPWDEHARWNQELIRAEEESRGYPDDDAGDPLRRTGRTTRAILEALARCVLGRKPKLYIGKGPEEIRKNCYREAETISERLGLDIWLRYLRFDSGANASTGDGIIYRDHAT
jgi:hypothetical protein